MRLSKVKEILSAQELVGAEGVDPDPDIMTGCGCDLMSDVLAFIKPGAMLLTGLTNPQSIRTADVADIRVVCYVRGKQPPIETLQLAREKGITVLATPLRLYEACGMLYKAGLPGLGKQ